MTLRSLHRASGRTRHGPLDTAAGSPDALLQLAPVVDVPTAAGVLGISRSAAYQLIHNGRWPTPVLHLGRTIRIPTVHLLALVGLHQDAEQKAVRAGRQP